MSKVNFDLRPVDTENIINARNRIRLSAVLLIFGVLLYFNINPAFKQPQASWAHLIHIIVQPIIIFITITDNTYFTWAGFVASVIASIIDTGVTILNFIALNRCFNEPTASCFDRLYENGTWLILGGWMVLFDILQVTQLYNLRSQLGRKDIIERKNMALQKIEKQVPTWNTVMVYSNKMRILNLLLVVFDITYIVVMATLLNKLPMLFIGMFHIFIDGYSYFVCKSNESGTFEILRVIYIISLICSAIVLVLIVQMDLTGIREIIATMIAISYVITDMIQVFYTSAIISTLANYKKFKASL